MPENSPVNGIDTTPQFLIEINGEPIKSYYPVLAVNTIHEISNQPRAEITLMDGSTALGSFPISDSTDFMPGNTIVISAGYSDSRLIEIFSGTVMGQALHIQESEAYKLVVTCKGKKTKTVKPDHNSPAVLNIVLGDSIRSFYAELTAEQQETAVKGHVSFIGNAGVNIGCMIALGNVGTRFSGNRYVTGVTHEIANGDWATTVKFGI